MHANPRKTTSVRALGNVDVDALAEAVHAIPEALWDYEDSLKPNRFETLDRTRHIVFRFVQDLRDWRTDYARPLWAEWRALLEPVLAQAVAPYGYARGVFPRVMFARMAPGGIIQPHRDNMPAALWPHKVHVPLQTNPKVGFFIEPKTYHFARGQVVEVNNLGVHAVRNDGDTDRIHLIFEYYDADQPSWLDAP
jgi:hypothetical protein